MNAITPLYALTLYVYVISLILVSNLIVIKCFYTILSYGLLSLQYTFNNINIYIYI